MIGPKIHEVGMRDGLQMESQTVPFEVKLRWLQLLAESGVDIIQVGSFVHPKLVPQMADTDELFRQFKSPGTVLSALVLNEKGVERGLACGAEMFCMGVSASETHSRKNTGMSVAEALERNLKMADLVQAEDKPVQLSVQSAFGCGYEGAVPPGKVLQIVETYVSQGFTDISLADTAGHADPSQVKGLFEAIHRLDDSVRCTAHFHDTYGMALANCQAALESGVVTLESSFGGLGGCPFTAVAGGNVASEDLVHMLQRSGQRQDIRLEPLMVTAGEASRFFGRDLPGCVYKVGPLPQPPHEYSQ